MMASVEKLREWLDYKINRFDVGENALLLNTGANPNELYDFADEIEREVSERFMELPVDADGVPWHIGDEIEGHGELRCMSVNRNGWTFVSSTAIDPGIHRHAKPRTIEDVLVEFYGKFAVARYGEDGEVLSHYADELRGMMAKEGGDD